MNTKQNSDRINPSLDIHQFDNRVDPKVYEFIQTVINHDSKKLSDRSNLAEIYIHEIATSALDPAKNKSRFDPRLIAQIAKAYHKNEFDHLNHTDIHTPFVVAWNLAKLHSEEDLFFLHLYDMHITNGYCRTGRTIRCLQIISCLMDSDSDIKKVVDLKK